MNRATVDGRTRTAMTVRAVALLALVAGAMALLGWLVPDAVPRHPVRLARSLPTEAPEPAITTLLALLAWAALGWLGMGIAATVAGRLPGALGAAAARAADRITPVAIRRALDVAVGVTVASGALASPLAAVPALAAGPPAVAARPVTPHPTGWPQAQRRPVLDLDRPVATTATDQLVGGLDRPTTSGARTLVPPAHRRAPGPHETTPQPARTTHPVALPPSAEAPSRPMRALSRSVQAPSRPAEAAPQETGPATPGAATARRTDPDAVVVVRPGDTLWAIAAAHLGEGADRRQVAAWWPRWYAANRSVIGPDPDLLQPGQRLRPPPG